MSNLGSFVSFVKATFSVLTIVGDQRSKIDETKNVNDRMTLLSRLASVFRSYNPADTLRLSLRVLGIKEVGHVVALSADAFLAA
jgi:hypothetical protein